MLKKDLENIKPISEKSFQSFLKDIREKGESKDTYGIHIYGLHLVNVKDYRKNDCKTERLDTEIEETISFYYKSGDPSCIASRLDSSDSPYKCFMGAYNK